ncbi:MAG: peptide deformylase [Verrucomicrobia bacterium]|nr:peptide deformylase [Verrucomicrobiota bacterium]
MILEITMHDHPALRTRGRAVEKTDAKIHRLAEEMIETMLDAEGIGLAAQQVGLPLQMFVLDVPQMKDRPSAMRVDGKQADFEALMPMVLINPVIEPFGRTRIESEGCLSFPGLRGDVPRPLSIRIKAQTLSGDEISFEADGLLARAVQHEFDHLQGILFIDRMSEEDRLQELPEDVRQLARPALVAGR